MPRIESRRDFLKFVGSGLLAMAFPPASDALSNPRHFIPTLARNSYYPSKVEPEEFTPSNNVTFIYSSGLLNLPVIQQPAYNAGFVSSSEGVATEFDLARQYGNIGILAHNYLAGKDFFNLKVGHQIHVFFGSEKGEKYEVGSILQYRAFDPYSGLGDFRDLATNEILTANELFHKVFMGPRHLTLLTCIDGNGEEEGQESWGRYFVIAVPITAKDQAGNGINRP